MKKNPKVEKLFASSLFIYKDKMKTKMITDGMKMNFMFLAFLKSGTSCVLD